MSNEIKKDETVQSNEIKKDETVQSNEIKKDETVQSNEIKKDETVQLNGQFIDKDHQNIVIEKKLLTNNNIVIDLLIKCDKLIQSLTTLLDFVNTKDSQDIINQTDILTPETYGKVQEFLINSISAINTEIAPKFEKINKEVQKNGTN